MSKGLVVFLHGHGQDAADWFNKVGKKAWTELASSKGFDTVAPQAKDGDWSDDQYHVVDDMIQRNLKVGMPLLLVGFSQGTGPALYYGLRYPTCHGIVLICGEGKPGWGPEVICSPPVRFVGLMDDPVVDWHKLHDKAIQLEDQHDFTDVGFALYPGTKHKVPGMETAKEQLLPLLKKVL